MTKGERVAFSYGRSSCVSGTLMAPAYDGRMRSLVSESRAERGIRSNMRNMAAWYIGYACQAAVAGRGITQEQFRGMMTAVIQCDSPSNITEGWAVFAKECVEAGQYPDLEETPDPETGVNRWLETILAGLLQIRGEYGDDIARELAALSLRPCCLYPGEMGHAAQILQAGGGVEQIEGYLAASKLEDGPPFYPHMEDIAELYMPKRQMNDLNMGGM